MAARAKVRFRPHVQLSGAVPPLAEGFFPRSQPSLDVRPGQTAVLVHGDATYAAPASQGGTGKTQLGVAYCHALRDRRAVEVLAWVNAASREAVVTGFAQAVSLVDAGYWGEGAEAAAARFVAWLERTRRPWTLILDDLADLGDLRELWPAGPAGRVLITTRLPATAFGATAPAGTATATAGTAATATAPAGTGAEDAGPAPRGRSAPSGRSRRTRRRWSVGRTTRSEPRPGAGANRPLYFARR